MAGICGLGVRNFSLRLWYTTVSTIQEAERARVMSKKTYISSSDKKTREIARKFADNLKVGDVVCLYGDLGFGKTTFTKGIAEGLGISTRIISPTFTIIREHAVKNHESRIMKLVHVDLYRVENEKQIAELGIEEILADQSSIKILEWAKKAHDLLPKKRWEVRFELAEKENERVINIYEQ